uniref:MULE transposase domain-containing protein n=1 Tax=Phaseolus vulgaris TaxID=3885 RepID=V7AQK9_PHAVU|nr:hypothetical protein PHAVU_010G085200g [Phaseolus vulgaris]ESW06893.1 hypothetical protein PHAVU_010G085200g [Phaseolus vulgaris]
MVNSIKANPSIPGKTLIAKIKSRYGYSIMYKEAWMEKKKAFAIKLDDWDESYNHLPRWLQLVQESFLGTFVEYVTRPFVIDDAQDNSCQILECVFWPFKPCIDDFNYCKPIVQVNKTFLTGKYHGTLLTAIGQDGNHNIFPLPFAIVEGETKVALIWFFRLLRSHVILQQNICMIADRGKTIFSALKSPEVAWKGHGLLLVYCISHIAFNFNKKFERTKSWLVERGTKIECMLRAGHQYLEDITALLRKNEQQSAMCHVQSCNRHNSEFDVQELPIA